MALARGVRGRPMHLGLLEIVLSVVLAALLMARAMSATADVR